MQKKEEKDLGIAFEKAIKMLDDCKPGENNNQIYLLVTSRYWLNLNRRFQIPKEKVDEFEAKFNLKYKLIYKELVE